MKKIFLLLIISLLFFSNARAQSWEPPIIVGETYEFTYSEISNCTQDKTESRSFYITAMNDSLRTFVYDLTVDNEETKGLTDYYFNVLFYVIFNPIWRTETKDFYFSTDLQEFLAPNFEFINNVIKTGLTLSNIDGNTNHLLKASSIDFMGETSLADGIAAITPDTRKWSISGNFSYYLRLYYDKMELSKEFQYHSNGILDYSRTTILSRLKDAETSCLTEKEYKSIPPVSSTLSTPTGSDTSDTITDTTQVESTPSTLPGFRIYHLLVILPILFARNKRGHH